MCRKIGRFSHSCNTCTYTDMFLCMRTTIDINDALLIATKSRAARDQKTLKAVVEQALSEYLSGSPRSPSDAPLIPVFRGLGVQPGVDLTDNAAIEELMNAEP